MTVIVKKVGGSMAVIIPASVAREMGLSEGTALELSSTGDAVVMRRRGRRARRPLRAIVAAIKPANYRRRGAEIADRPVGKEPW